MTDHGSGAREGSPGYAVLGRLIIDDLVFADGSEVRGMLGGAGLYAALGAALVGERPAGLVSGVGRDLGRTALDRIEAWRISTAALTVAGEHTPRSRVVYRDDGSREETPLLGRDHFRSMAPRVAGIPATWHSLRGVYLFAGTDPRDWDGAADYARARNCRLLWEIAADACTPDHFDAVRALLGQADIFSANLAEARALCAVEEPAECVAALVKAGAARVALRMGAAGALVADGREVWHIGAAPSAPVADPTGAGNCHSGALLAAFADTGDLTLAGCRAAAAASLVIEQHGPPALSGRTGDEPAALVDRRTRSTVVHRL